VLRGQLYTQASDIYSLGIIAYELFSGLPPYYNISHNKFLGLKICQGLRPELDNIRIPRLLKDLIRKCWDADPLKRPTASEWEKFYNDMNSTPNLKDTEFGKQLIEIKRIEGKKLSLLINDLTYQNHPQAIYASRLLEFKNLPEPRNSQEINDKFYNYEDSGQFELKLSTKSTEIVEEQTE